MARLLTNIGEEYYTETALGGVTLSVGVYDDASDSVSDADDLPLGSEPGNTNYARQSDTFSEGNVTTGNYGIQNDTELSFDFTDESTSAQIDSWFVVANFDSDEAGDGGTAADHLVATGALSGGPYDVGSLETLKIDPGGVTIDVD